MSLKMPMVASGLLFLVCCLNVALAASITTTTTFNIPRRITVAFDLSRRPADGSTASSSSASSDFFSLWLTPRRPRVFPFRDVEANWTVVSGAANETLESQGDLALSLYHALERDLLDAIASNPAVSQSPSLSTRLMQMEVTKRGQSTRFTFAVLLPCIGQEACSAMLGAVRDTLFGSAAQGSLLRRSWRMLSLLQTPPWNRTVSSPDSASDFSFWSNAQFNVSNVTVDSLLYRTRVINLVDRNDGSSEAWGATQLRPSIVQAAFSKDIATFLRNRVRSILGSPTASTASPSSSSQQSAAPTANDLSTDPEVIRQLSALSFYDEDYQLDSVADITVVPGSGRNLAPIRCTATLFIFAPTTAVLDMIENLIVSQRVELPATSQMLRYVVSAARETPTDAIVLFNAAELARNKVLGLDGTSRTTGTPCSDMTCRTLVALWCCTGGLMIFTIVFAFSGERPEDVEAASLHAERQLGVVHQTGDGGESGAPAEADTRGGRQPAVGAAPRGRIPAPAAVSRSPEPAWRGSATPPTRGVTRAPPTAAVPPPAALPQADMLDLPGPAVPRDTGARAAGGAGLPKRYEPQPAVGRSFTSLLAEQQQQQQRQMAATATAGSGAPLQRRSSRMYAPTASDAAAAVDYKVAGGGSGGGGSSAADASSSGYQSGAAARQQFRHISPAAGA